MRVHVNPSSEVILDLATTFDVRRRPGCPARPFFPVAARSSGLFFETGRGSCASMMKRARLTLASPRRCSSSFLWICPRIQSFRVWHFSRGTSRRSQWVSRRVSWPSPNPRFFRWGRRWRCGHCLFWLLLQLDGAGRKKCLMPFRPARARRGRLGWRSGCGGFLPKLKSSSLGASSAGGEAATSSSPDPEGGGGGSVRYSSRISLGGGGGAFRGIYLPLRIVEIKLFPCGRRWEIHLSKSFTQFPCFACRGDLKHLCSAVLPSPPISSGSHLGCCALRFRLRLGLRLGLGLGLGLDFRLRFDFRLQLDFRLHFDFSGSVRPRALWAQQRMAFLQKILMPRGSAWVMNAAFSSCSFRYAERQPTAKKLLNMRALGKPFDVSRSTLRC